MMLIQIIALGPKMALIRGSIVLHRLIKGNVKNLRVRDSGPLWPSCFQDWWAEATHGAKNGGPFSEMMGPSISN